jgi:hypothetical protein
LSLIPGSFYAAASLVIHNWLIIVDISNRKPGTENRKPTNTHTVAYTFLTRPMLSGKYGRCIANFPGMENAVMGNKDKKA